MCIRDRYMARAEGGGSAYGVLRRRAFAQTSLRIRRPAALEDSSTSVEGVSRQRRSRSLIPPPRRRSGDQGSADASLSNHKSLLQALCVQTQQQQKQQQRTKRTGTPQVNRLDEWACNASHYGLKFISVSIVHGVSLKRTPFSFFHNLLKWWSIYKIFLPVVIKEILIPKLLTNHGSCMAVLC